MDDVLKGNFKVKNPVNEGVSNKKQESKSETLKADLKKKALASLGGSMVYMDRNVKFTWDGDE